MKKIITKAEFDTIASQNTIGTEKDGAYSYENVVDQDGNELAFATYRTGQEPVYTLHCKPE